jgi:hypothetical protein
VFKGIKLENWQVVIVCPVKAIKRLVVTKRSEKNIGFWRYRKYRMRIVKGLLKSGAEV